MNIAGRFTVFISHKTRCKFIYAVCHIQQKDNDQQDILYIGLRLQLFYIIVYFINLNIFTFVNNIVIRIFVL